MVVTKSYGFYFVAGVNSDGDRELVQNMKDKYGDDRVLERSYYTKNISVGGGNGQKMTVPFIFQDITQKNRHQRRTNFALKTRKNSELIGLSKSNHQDRTKKKRW